MNPAHNHQGDPRSAQARRKFRSAACAGLFVPFTLIAATGSLAGTTNELSLEELVNIKVTSVSKKETSLGNSPAAVTVITQDDLRRLGIDSIPEALRLVPGMDVARISANTWSIGSRGFNQQYADKMLVLMDGRSVYSPLFGGVYWNVQDTDLGDLDRIEVIRGPGATLWGANAVNGVVNIISKSSKDTQGLLVSVAGGTEDQPSTTVRYGGQLVTNLYYRAYVKYFNRDSFVDASGNNTPDAWSAVRGGFRTDWEPSDENLFTLQGDYYSMRAGERQTNPIFTPPYTQETNMEDLDHGGNILGRWTHTFSDVSHLSVQSYFDYYRNQDESRNTADVQLEHRFPVSTWNDVIWGAGYRYTWNQLLPWANANPMSRGMSFYNGFLQDEITLVPGRLQLTLGSKLEHNDFTGFELEPGARLLWTPTKHQSVWASISRAVSTPGQFYHDVQLINSTGPGFATVYINNPNLVAETLVAYELGYRIEPARNLSFDAAAFYNDYQRLFYIVQGTPVFVPGPPPYLEIPLVWQNNIAGHSYGAEVSVQWKPANNWRLMASYSWLHMQFPSEYVLTQGSPQQQIGFRSYLDLPEHLELNNAIYFVDAANTLTYGGATTHIPAYVRVDAGLVWRPAKSLEIGIWGQNLLDDRHPEASGDFTTLLTEIPRSVLAKVTWHF